ncbi:MAG: amidase domain-containing protein [Candidatus Cloacimonadales bacterium]
MKKMVLILIMLCSQVWLPAENSPYQPEKYQGEAQIEYVIEHYFQQKYKSIKKLEASDFSYQIADWIAETRNWAAEEIALRELILQQAKIYDLGYIDYDFQLEIKEIRYLQEGQKAVVKLLESHQVIFAATQPLVSELANRSHLISLRLRAGIWYISYDQYDHEYAQMLKDIGQPKVEEKIAAAYAEGNQELTAPLKPAAFEPKKNFHAYDRAAAVEYAQRYWKDYNSDFDDFENNNCTNYISQILLTGGAPMDFEGNLHWYYENPQTAGDSYSFSWTVVQDLYYYLVKNNWTGPVGRKVSICEMKPGDIVQFYSPTKGWLHSVVVVKNLEKWSCGNQLNYLINSHTTDRKNYPLAYFSAQTKRFIQVEGWYE